jgi:hypothetical protein
VSAAPKPPRFPIITLARQALLNLNVRVAYEQLAAAMKLLPLSQVGSSVADARRLEELRVCIRRAEEVIGALVSPSADDGGRGDGGLHLTRRGCHEGGQIDEHCRDDENVSSSRSPSEAAGGSVMTEVMERLSLTQLLKQAQDVVIALEAKMKEDEQELHKAEAERLLAAERETQV